jgi:translation initiation factor 2 alpha subunit (eIF-2alpha)
MPSRSKGRRWSAKVTETSNAMDLEPEVFEQKDPKRIAASLKRSAEHSKRRKASPFQSAMSMLTFYMNRAGKNLLAERKETLEKAKDELRKDFGRD